MDRRGVDGGGGFSRSRSYPLGRSGVGRDGFLVDVPRGLWGGRVGVLGHVGVGAGVGSAVGGGDWFGSARGSVVQSEGRVVNGCLVTGSCSRGS